MTMQAQSSYCAPVAFVTPAARSGVPDRALATLRIGSIIAFLHLMGLVNSAAGTIEKFRGANIDPTTRHARAGTQSLALTSAIAAATFVLLGVAVERGATRDIDRRVRRIIGPRRSKRLTNVARLASNLGSPHVHPFVAAALALAMYRRCGRNVLAIPIASLGATAADLGVRCIIHQSRPPGASRHRGLDRFAFPSGHTGAATAIGLAVAGQAAWDTPAQKRMAATIALAAPVGIAWTRQYLDEHWIDDIVGGWLAGVTIGAASVAATRGGP